MIFTHKKWKSFCHALQKKGITCIPAYKVNSTSNNYVVLKHDVETDVARAYEIAKIESAFGHKGSYYVQAYLLENSKNIELLKEMQKMGHEISYHYDVMDSCKGNLDAAVEEFEKNRLMFENNGFHIVTVCQHGNPIVERVGYTSNRDFFRSSSVREMYPDISDIMVNFKQQVPTEYLYFSDAGRVFKLIYDPINNDVVDSDDKNIPYADLDALLNALDTSVGNIISIHPHRWTSSALLYITKTFIFKVFKSTAKVLIRIPLFKKIMSKYYYLAKKI